jgi:uncharacterized protein (DUF2235 family)
VPKNIVVCCDGTGNEFRDNNSNVVKLYYSLVIDPSVQIGYYHPGVGTMGAPTAHNRFTKKWSVFTGLAFGAGLLNNVADAYRYVMDLYEPGDRLFLFGFSRGAYTVRALAGVLHMFGLLRKGNEGLIPYVTRLYAKRSRDAEGMKHTFRIAEDFKATFSQQCPVHFAGLWDTVSSVGWIWDPIRLPYVAQNPDLHNGRHAVSIDERRCYFRNNLWGSSGPNQNIKQVWFAGVHSDVGGSYPEQESGLSKITLQWMIREATCFGLLTDLTRVDYILGLGPAPSPTFPVEHPPVPPDVTTPLHNSLTSAWWTLEAIPHSYFDAASGKVRWRIPMGARRMIPENSTLHVSVQEKWNRDPAYRPPNVPNAYAVER